MRVPFAAILVLIPCILSGCLPHGPERPSWPIMMVAPGESLMQLDLESGNRAMMKRVGVNGSVETWMTQDRFSVSLAEGVVVATRGFGFDVMASDAAPTLSALTEGPTEDYARGSSHLRGDHRTFWRQAGCTMAAPVQDERDGRNLWRHAETCQSRNDHYTNLYWTDAAGVIQASKQWLAPELGYIRLARVTK